MNPFVAAVSVAQTVPAVQKKAEPVQPAALPATPKAQAAAPVQATKANNPAWGGASVWNIQPVQSAAVQAAVPAQATKANNPAWDGASVWNIQPVQSAAVQAAVPVQAAKAKLPAWVFGAAEWNKYFGDVGAEPPIPDDIVQRLPELSLNNVLVLVPAAVNGQPLTLRTLGELVQNPKNGGHKTNNVFYLGKYVDKPAESHWALLTRTVIEGSRNKYCQEAPPIVAAYRQKTKMAYTIPNVLDAAVCNMMEYVRSGTWLYGSNPYGDNPLTFTWCQEKWDDSNYLVVGGGSSLGIYVGESRGYFGVGGLMKFGAAVPVQPAKAPTLPAWVFGASEWNKYFGDVGAEPPLPDDIVQRLPELSKNNVLVLIPKKVNGEPLTLHRLIELVQNPRNGGFPTRYSHFYPGEYYVDEPAESHWALLTRTVIEGSRSKLMQDEHPIVAAYSQKTNIAYTFPAVLDAVVCNFMEYVRSGTWLYGENPTTCTWCAEAYNADYYLVVGYGSVSGLHVGNGGGAYVQCGVAGFRKF
jgi:hypothetical protein